MVWQPPSRGNLWGESCGEWMWMVRKPGWETWLGGAWRMDGWWSVWWTIHDFWWWLMVSWRVRVVNWLMNWLWTRSWWIDAWRSVWSMSASRASGDSPRWSSGELMVSGYSFGGELTPPRSVLVGCWWLLLVYCCLACYFSSSHGQCLLKLKFNLWPSSSGFMLFCWLNLAISDWEVAGKFSPLWQMDR